MILLWTLIGFGLGSLPFSLWVGRLLLHADIRDYGDGNPGATNLWRAGSPPAAVLGALLDAAKAAAPVSIAHFVLHIEGWWLVPIALAPLAGHAFSPLLRFRGGKAVASTFGVWIGLTGVGGVLMLAVCFGVIYAFNSADAWTPVLGLTSWLVFLVLRDAELSLRAVATVNLALIMYRHREDLVEGARRRRWLLARKSS